MLCISLCTRLWLHHRSRRALFSFSPVRSSLVQTPSVPLACGNLMVTGYRSAVSSASSAHFLPVVHAGSTGPVCWVHWFHPLPPLCCRARPGTFVSVVVHLGPTASVWSQALPSLGCGVATRSMSVPRPSSGRRGVSRAYMCSGAVTRPPSLNPGLSLWVVLSCGGRWWGRVQSVLPSTGSTGPV